MNYFGIDITADYFFKSMKQLHYDKNRSVVYFVTSLLAFKNESYEL